MNKYFFILGRDPVLSIAEILSVFSNLKISYKTSTVSDEVLLLSSGSKLDISKLNQSLGGTVKIGTVLDQANLEDSEEKFNKIFSANNLLGNFLPEIEGKLHFGISIYNAGGDEKYLKALFAGLKSLDLLVKKNLAKEGKKAGFVKIKNRFLSSVSVEKNKLLTKGAEIVLVLTKDKVLVGKTLAVQKFGQFSLRDVGRPKRDRRAGIMPPKLARIMVNLSQIEEDGVLLDPFCGSGTILQEAVILNIKSVIGSDISGRAIDNSQRNLDWLFSTFTGFKKADYDLKLFHLDVTHLEQKIKPESVDAIVTEPYLGPPLYEKPGEEKIKEILTEVKDLYLTSFSQFSKVLKPDGIVVVILPVFETEEKVFFLRILTDIKKMGFTVKKLLEDEESIIIGEKKKFIRREIICFKKKKSLDRSHSYA